MKVLINTPQITKLGGVANHYLGLQPYWKEEVRYNTIGSREKISGSVLLPYDVLKFIVKCIFSRPNLVVLNPSLNEKALKRDAFYLMISKLLGLKTLVFFHGWNAELEKSIDQNPKSFLKKYQRADGFFVLANSFSNTLKNWGITKPIYLTTTKVNDTLLDDFSISTKDYSKCDVLFLSRIEIEKGIFIALEAFEKLKKEIPMAKLTIVGDGKALEEAKQFAVKNNISGISFTGALQGKSLIEAFQNHTIYLFPTQHGEGMPTSVLEAMAFGLPIITRPVGGLNDFFKNEKMGYLIDSIQPEDFAAKLSTLLNNKSLLSEIGKQNHYYAKNHFLASIVSEKMEAIFKLNH